MSFERLDLLDEATQEKLAIRFSDQELFGVAEDPADYTPLKSERMSPHYFNLRPGIASYETRRMVGETMLTLANRKAELAGYEDVRQAYDYFVGNPEAMTSFAATTADLAEMPLLQPRVDIDKSRGNKSPILGRYEPGAEVAAFDDVVTDGESKIMMIDFLEEKHIDVIDYFVVVDREEGGAAQVYEEANLAITAALGVSRMVKILRANNRISDTQFDNVRQYLAEYGDPHTLEALGTK
jgi:orotate phosphoribosyltransferase